MSNNNRELSQFASRITVDDSTKNVSIASTLELSGGGKLGIGTDNPSKSLSILSSQSVMLQLEGTTNTARIGFKVPNTTNSPTIGVSDEEDIQFRVGGSERVRMTSSGDVGIGTTGSLGYPLQIVQGSGDNITNFYVNVGGYIHLDRNHARKPEFDLSMASGRPSITLSHAEDYGTVTDKIRLGVTGDNYLNGSGDVGIGTDVPAHKLDVAGTIAASTFRENGSTSSAAPVAYFGNTVGSGGPTSNISFSIDNNGASVAVFSIYCSFYGGSTGTTPYNSHITFMIRNGGAGPNGHITVDYGSITATESYDSGNDEFDITLTTPSGTRPYGTARVIQII